MVTAYLNGESTTVLGGGDGSRGVLAFANQHPWESLVRVHNEEDVQQMAELAGTPLGRVGQQRYEWSEGTLFAAVDLLALPPFPTQADLMHVRFPSSQGGGRRTRTAGRNQPVAVTAAAASTSVLEPSEIPFPDNAQSHQYPFEGHQSRPITAQSLFEDLPDSMQAVPSFLKSSSYNLHDGPDLVYSSFPVNQNKQAWTPHLSNYQDQAWHQTTNSEPLACEHDGFKTTMKKKLSTKIRTKRRKSAPASASHKKKPATTKRKRRVSSVTPIRRT